MKRREFLTGTLSVAAISAVPVPLRIFTGPRWSELSERDGEDYMTISLLRRDGKEVAYDGYYQQTVSRSPETWTIGRGVVTNRVEIAFPRCGP